MKFKQSFTELEREKVFIDQPNVCVGVCIERKTKYQFCKSNTTLKLTQNNELVYYTFIIIRSIKII